MAEKGANLPDRPDGENSYGRERAKAAFCDELLCCYTCGKIYFTRRPIRLRASGNRIFHICIECSNSLRCAGCDKPVTTRSAVVVEGFSDIPSGFFCPDCRDEVFYAPPIPVPGIGARFRSAAASIREGVRGFFLKISRFRAREGRKND